MVASHPSASPSTGVVIGDAAPGPAQRPRGAEGLISFRLSPQERNVLDFLLSRETAPNRSAFIRRLVAQGLSASLIDVARATAAAAPAPQCADEGNDVQEAA